MSLRSPLSVIRAATTLAASAALVGSVLGEQGCSSDVEGSTPPPCTLPAGVKDDFCSAVAAVDGRCGHCNDCRGKNLEKCTKRGESISAAHRAAYIVCKDRITCDENMASLLGCVQEEMAKAVPTLTQTQAKDAYCAACGTTNAADCASFFSVDPKAGKNGAGYSLLLAGDKTATRAISLCSSKCNPLDYGVCVALISCGEAGGDYCQDSGFCAPQ